jgi:hypothetical protein
MTKDFFMDIPRVRHMSGSRFVSLYLVPHKKGPLACWRPKSREETPNEGTRYIPSDLAKCSHDVVAICSLLLLLRVQRRLGLRSGPGGNSPFFAQLHGVELRLGFISTESACLGGLELRPARFQWQFHRGPLQAALARRVKSLAFGHRHAKAVQCR